jgi:hypothetical protein
VTCVDRCHNSTPVPTDAGNDHDQSPNPNRPFRPIHLLDSAARDCYSVADYTTLSNDTTPSGVDTGNLGQVDRYRGGGQKHGMGLERSSVAETAQEHTDHEIES